MNYHLDFETYSEADLNSVGAHRYARDPSCEVLCLAISRGHEKPLLWVPPAYQHQLSFIDPLEQMEALEMLNEMMADEANLIYAHNASFEYVIWNEIMVKQHKFPPLNPKQMRCTQAMARRACIPQSLAKCGAYLQLGQQKDARGSTLIRKFCIPQKPDKTHGFVWRRFPQDDPAAFKEFCEYCVQDVRTEQEVEKALKLFDVGGISHAAFVYDLIINDEGFPVDIEALRAASQMIDNELDRVRGEFIKLTGLNPTQTGAFTIWLRERGYKGEDLRASTMDEEIENWEPSTSDMDRDALKALELRRVMSYAATKKVKSMLELAGPDDNRVRGTLFYHGASTGRWSSKLVQQQNMKRSTDESEAAFHHLRQGLSADTLELIHGPILETLASGIRHFINDGDAPLDSVDYAAIEARIVCWLAGQEDALDEFNRNVDRYKTMAARIFNIRPENVTKPQRFLGKQSVLGCGYGMGASKFQATCANYGEDVPMDLAELAVQTFRKTHRQVVSLWYDLERACKNAINNPGNKYVVGKLEVFTMATAGRRFLLIKLPSKRHLAFPDPAIEDDQITFYGQIPMKQQWGRISTYGGKLVENCLTGDTLVLTEQGWVPLNQITHQPVHDGIEFVAHGGLIAQGNQVVILKAGFTATPDHKFLTKLGWKALCCVQGEEELVSPDEQEISIQSKTQQTNESGGETVRNHGRCGVVPHQRQNPLECVVRLWRVCREGWGRLNQKCKQASVLFKEVQPCPSKHCSQTNCAWDVQAPSLGSVAQHEAEMFGQQPPSIQKLWWQRDSGLRGMGELICCILEGHGGHLAEGYGIGQGGQQWALPTEELPMDYQTGQLCKQAEQCGESGRIGLVRPERDWSVNPLLEVAERGEDGSSPNQSTIPVQEVFDLRNCGKRRRFIVKSPTTGKIAIAHNCTQGVAADVMTMGTVNAVKAGHKIVMLVHDEAVRLTRDSPHSLDHFTKCLTDMPEWASGLPLAAEGATIEFYKK